MEDGPFPPYSSFEDFSATYMDLDLWDGTSQYLPTIGSSCLSINSHKICQNDIENFTKTPYLDHPETGEAVAAVTFSPESDLDESWWSVPSCSAKDRLMIAIDYLKEFAVNSDILIQIWVPTRTKGKIVLTTIDQPYSLNPNNTSLASYRDASKAFHLAAEEDSEELAGLPGRVFQGKFPEWTPDVRFFRNDECPRKDYAKLYSISGCLALPVFEPGSGICLAVVEIVTTTQRISYHQEMESVCKALEVVDLKSSRELCPLGVKACLEFYRVAVPDIPDILQSVCKTNGLPLALTWAPYTCQLKRRNQTFAKKYASCISTINSACFIANPRYEGFYVACSEQHLFPDQGIVGKAFATNKKCFSTDITSFSKTEYALSHHARMFGLSAAIAIPLQSVHSGLVEFVLELFLPSNCKEIERQKRISNLLSDVIQEACQGFYVVMENELEVEVNQQIAAGRPVSSPLIESHLEESSWITDVMEAQEKGEFVCASMELPELAEPEELNVTIDWANAELDQCHKQAFPDFGQQQKLSEPKSSTGGGENSSTNKYPRLLGSRKSREKRQTKPEKTINLQVLQQYFAGSLKNAAESLGVGPTTLKKICRQHGINRWPSRKIKKVSHSLKRLQHLLDSVHGAKGLIQLDSFYTTFPELSSPNSSDNAHLLQFEKTGNLSELDLKPENGPSGLKGTDSRSQSSSSRQNSASHACSSSAAKRITNTISGLSTRHALDLEDPILALKRTCSEADLQSLNQEEPAKCQGHKPFGAHERLETPLPLAKRCGQSSPDEVVYRVKAAFGEENIRFSLQPNWYFKDLQHEIAKRFNIHDFNGIDLRYLDDDHEQVLLTCDADLEECKDLFRFSKGHIIKISLHQTSPTQFRKFAQ